MTEELEKAFKELKKELEIGAKIHEALLLGQLPKKVPGLSVEVSTLPSQAIDGDFFEFYSPNDTRLDIVLGDVMGKGIPAALMGTVVKTQLIRFAMPPLSPAVFDKINGWREATLPIDDILSHVHEAIGNELIKLEYFVSLIYGRFDVKRRLFSFVDCGFTKPIHYLAKEKKALFHKGENFPLGMVAHDTYQTVDIPFEQDDIFVFYSDGITEAKAKNGELFGRDRIKKIVEENPHLSALELKDQLFKAVCQFQTDENFQDDLSLIVVKVDSIPLFQTQEKTFVSDLKELSRVRMYTKQEVHKGGGSEKFAEELSLAINELFCNIVEHGYKGTFGNILVRIEPDSTGIKVEISDQGLSFKPLSLERQNSSERGFGWVIIQQLIDKALYVPKQAPNGWNRLELYKNFYNGKENMEIAHAIEQDHLIITPLGESLDARETPEFKEKVFKLIDQSSCSAVVFDLKKVTFIDSSGLGCFLSILRRLNKQGGTLRLTNLSDSVRSLFELVLMHKIFDITPDLQSALK